MVGIGREIIQKFIHSQKTSDFSIGNSFLGFILSSTLYLSYFHKLKKGLEGLVLICGGGNFELPTFAA